MGGLPIACATGRLATMTMVSPSARVPRPFFRYLRMVDGPSAQSPLRDDPALPERLMRADRDSPRRLLALLVGSFASRRLSSARLGARPSSLGFRLGVGRWYLDAPGGAPTIARGPELLAHQGALAAVLLAWSLWFAAIFRTAIGAQPLERSDLRAAFDEILARSRAKAPGLYSAGPRGGRWVSALALPSVHGSAVLMSDTLLELFDRDAPRFRAGSPIRGSGSAARRSSRGARKSLCHGRHRDKRGRPTPFRSVRRTSGASRPPSITSTRASPRDVADPCPTPSSRAL